MGSKEISGRVSAAYGGMRYGNESPPASTLGTDYEQITLFNRGLPLLGDSRLVRFDLDNQSTMLDKNEDGVFSTNIFINFEGQQSTTYTITVFLDRQDGNGPQPTEASISPRLSQGDSFEIAQRSVMLQLEGGWSFSLWAKADKAAVTFNIFAVSFQLIRIGERTVT